MTGIEWRAMLLFTSNTTLPSSCSCIGKQEHSRQLFSSFRNNTSPSCSVLTNYRLRAFAMLNSKAAQNKAMKCNANQVMRNMCIVSLNLLFIWSLAVYPVQYTVNTLHYTALVYLAMAAAVSHKQGARRSHCVRAARSNIRVNDLTTVSPKAQTQILNTRIWWPFGPPMSSALVHHWQ